MAADRYRWDGRRYRDSVSGRYVGAATVRRALDTVLRNDERRARTLADDLRAGRISRDAWHREMRGLVAEAHLYSAAAARGGWHAMTPAAYGQVGSAVRAQYRYLQQFVNDLESGLPLDGRFSQRASLYLQAARNTFYRADRAVQRANGMTEESNALEREAQHCAGANSCPAETAKGWVPLGALLLPGSRTCLVSCRCRILYR